MLLLPLKRSFELTTYTRYAYFNIKIQYDSFEDEWNTFIAHVSNVINLKYIPKSCIYLKFLSKFVTWYYMNKNVSGILWPWNILYYKNILYYLLVYTGCSFVSCTKFFYNKENLVSRGLMNYVIQTPKCVFDASCIIFKQQQLAAIKIAYK